MDPGTRRVRHLACVSPSSAQSPTNDCLLIAQTSRTNIADTRGTVFVVPAAVVRMPSELVTRLLRVKKDSDQQF
jgi:hypothetical protein